MVRTILQKTYDEVVKENIEELDMTPEEAIQEAVAQFEAQGVDLTNIIKDLALNSVENHIVSDTIHKLRELSSVDINSSEVLEQLEILKSECNKDLARRMKAAEDGAYKILINLLSSKSNVFPQELSEIDRKFIQCVLDTLTALMDTQPDLLDVKGIDLIKSILDNVENEDILIATLQWTANCCVKHEMNRQKIFSKNIPENLKLLLKVNGNEKLLIETLQVIRKLTLDDDIRVEFGKAHDQAKELCFMMLEPLKNLMKENPEPPLISELMSTLSCLLVRHELCAAAGDCSLLDILTNNYERANVAHQASKLITALAGNDDVKRDLMKKGIAPVIISLLNRHSSNSATAGSLLKSIAALVLREPSHSIEFFENGAPEVIVECLKVHPDNASVQKNGCWAIRNMVARNREQNAKYHELGIEGILKRSYDKFEKDFGFDVKSALRDLECDVKLDEPWTGKGVELEY